jgi:tetratricopeptide (TPR) repeat protein
MKVTEEKNGGSSAGSSSSPSSASTMKPPVRRSVSTTSDAQAITYEPSITLAVFFTWIFPVLLIAILTRFAVDKEAEFVGMGIMGSRGGVGRPVTIDLNNENKPTVSTQSTPTTPRAGNNNDIIAKPKKPGREPSSVPTYLSNKPSGYVEVVQAIERRRLDWSTTYSAPLGSGGSSSSARPPAASSTKPTTTKAETSAAGRQNDHSTTSSKPKLRDPPRGASSDPVRTQMMEKIEKLRIDYEADNSNLFTLLDLADLLRMHDVQYHDGGSLQEETIRRYQTALDMALDRKQKLIEQGEETNRNSHGTVDVNEEIMLDYTERSIDGILCAIYTALGKTYFMANMFERAVSSYSQALDIEPLYLDAVSSRGSARIILGQYEGAAQDFTITMENDTAGRFLDVFTGLARVLQARESAVPQGWDPMIDTLEAMIPTFEIQYDNLATAVANGGNPSAERGRVLLANTLNRLYHVLFLYHDVKTKDTNAAWNSLTKSYQYKMSALPSWNSGFESQKILQTKQIFHRGFWPEGVGSSSAVPIFIIGFVRSGSTLLERILDAHPQIVGTGENRYVNRSCFLFIFWCVDVVDSTAVFLKTCCHLVYSMGSWILFVILLSRRVSRQMQTILKT